jgi:hypothetical protein
LIEFEIAQGVKSSNRNDAACLPGFSRELNPLYFHRIPNAVPRKKSACHSEFVTKVPAIMFPPFYGYE